MGGGGRGLLTNGRGVANIWLQFLVVIGWAGLGWAGLGWAARCGDQCWVPAPEAQFTNNPRLAWSSSTL